MFNIDLTEEDPVEMDESCSPQFAMEVNRMKTNIRKLVEDNPTRKFFAPISINTGDNTAFLRVQFNAMMAKMEETEKTYMMKALVRLVHFVAEKHSPDRVFIGTLYERAVDKLFRYALEKESITLRQCVEALIMTTDFRMKTRIDQEKWKFIQESIPKIDYKGIRNILRYILESQIRRIPSKLCPEQVNEIRIVEQVVLRIVDQDKIMMPSLITLSELNNAMQGHAHIFPKLMVAFSDICFYFRPIADLAYVCGRQFIYPIPLHPAHIPGSPFWEDFGLHSHHNFHQTHHTLPYRPEHTTMALHTIYMILKQPLGKDSFQLQTPSKSKLRPHWDHLVSSMICDAMGAAEKLPENAPIPRYQWENITNMVVFGMQHNILNPRNFCSLLKGLVKVCKYTRARDEVMWIIFQMITCPTSHNPAKNGPSVDAVAVQEIVELYNVLFEGQVVWQGASDHPARFARFLAAASIWIILKRDHPDKIPEPNENLKTQIDFILTQSIDNLYSNNTDKVAVLSNVVNDRKTTDKLATVIHQLLENVNPSQPMFELSYKRLTVNSLAGVSTEFIDALTLHSKKTLLSQALSMLRGFVSDRLPAPSVFETIATLCISEDFELAVKEVESLALRSMHVSHQHHGNPLTKDQCHCTFDFLTYRLPYLPSHSKSISAVSNVISHFIQPMANNPQNHQLYRLLEQFLIRRWNWKSFHDITAYMTTTFGNNYKENAMVRHFMNPRTFVTPVDSYHFPINPDLLKMTVYSFLRAAKITGQEIIVEGTMFPMLIQNFGWPEKSTTYFTQWALDSINKESSAFLPNYTEILETVHETVRLHPSLTANQFILQYGENQDPKIHYCMMAVLFKIALNSGESKLDFTSEFYEKICRVMAKKSPKDIAIMGNYLIDFIIADVKNENRDEHTFKNIARAAAILCFHNNIHRADRFLLSLVVHPTTDEDAQICIQIANEFILTPEFQERIKWFYQNVPKKELHPVEYIKAIVKYHDQFPEFESSEMAINNDQGQNAHLPTYYGCLMERFLPILDQYLFVALEQQGYKLNPQILQSVALLYKYHPMPIHFMYSLLFITHGKMEGPDVKSFVTAFAAQCDEVHLTEAFEKFNHQKSSKEQLIVEWVDRLTESLDFILEPPSYVAKDWKQAELSPGAQTLYLACIEIMASPHSPDTLVAAMINVMQMKPHLRPFNVMNLISLILTALPSAYGDALHQEFIAVFDNEDTKKLKFEDIVFDNYEECLRLCMPNRTRTINAISQFYFMHCNVNLLKLFADEHVPRALKHVKTEKDLWYLLRVTQPIIRRFLEQPEIVRMMRIDKYQFGPLTIMRMILEKLGEMAESGITFEKDHLLCDLIYNAKYVFTGDFLRDTAIKQFEKLSESMRERLRFYVSQEPPPEEMEKSMEKEKEEEKQKEQQGTSGGHNMHQPLESTPSASSSVSQVVQQPQHQQSSSHHQQPQHSLSSSQLMPPPQQPLQHHHSQQHPHQMEQHHSQQQQMHSQQQQVASHHQMNMGMGMNQAYPGAVFHSPHHGMGQYGMHMQHPHHPQMPGQMHMNPMMHNMTPQQYYMMQQQHYQQQLQQHHAAQQQQQQQHHQPPHM